ncbi:MAG: phosphate ABC transporter permease subunit PstC [Maricaulaceae bacterium]
MTNFPIYIIALLAAVTLAGFFLNRDVARKMLQTSDLGVRSNWHSQSSYHGFFTAWCVAAAGLLIFFTGLFLSGSSASSTFNLAWIGTFLVVTFGAIFFCRRYIRAEFRARTHVERCIHAVLVLLSAVAIFTTLGIILSLAFESWRFFEQVSPSEFLFGLHWSPQTALRADQAGSSGSFGAVPIFAGTFLIMFVAILVAGPIGLMIAVYLSEYAAKRTRAIVKPLIEILAGIPTVVYGFFALLTVGPFIRQFTETLGFAVPTQSAISAGIVMGIMIIPLISSLSDDVINSVPQTLRDGSLALGATKSETMKQVIFAGALPGIIGAFLLAISRAIGETMIVVMAAGRAANLTANPFEAVTTVTVQIVSLLTGDQEFDSPKTLAAFALGLVLFVITLLLNVVALTIVRRYRERYD